MVEMANEENAVVSFPPMDLLHHFQGPVLETGLDVDPVFSGLQRLTDRMWQTETVAAVPLPVLVQEMIGRHVGLLGDTEQMGIEFFQRDVALKRRAIGKKAQRFVVPVGEDGSVGADQLSLVDLPGLGRGPIASFFARRITDDRCVRITCRQVAIGRAHVAAHVGAVAVPELLQRALPAFRIVVSFHCATPARCDGPFL